MEGTATLNGISEDYFAAVWERDDAEASERMQEQHEKPYKALYFGEVYLFTVFTPPLDSTKP